MADIAVTKAKRTQALRIALFLVALAMVTTLLFRVVHRGAISFRQAESAYARHDYAAAAEAYGRAVDAGFQSPGLDWHHATSLLETSRQAEALVVLERIIANHPDDRNAVTAAAGVAQGLGQTAKAEAYYAKLETAGRLDLADLVRLIDIRQQAGRLDEAIATCRQALAIAPGSADLHAALGELLSWQPDRRDEAVRELQAAVRIAPHHPTARVLLGRVLAWQGRLAESIAAYRDHLGE